MHLVGGGFRQNLWLEYFKLKQKPIGGVKTVSWFVASWRFDLNMICDQTLRPVWRRCDRVKISWDKGTSLYGICFFLLKTCSKSSMALGRYSSHQNHSLILQSVVVVLRILMSPINSFNLEPCHQQMQALDKRCCNKRHISNRYQQHVIHCYYWIL